MCQTHLKTFPSSFLLMLFVFTARLSAQDPFPVLIEVNAASDKGDLHRIWRNFGADEPNYASMKDGRKLLGKLGELAHRREG